MDFLTYFMSTHYTLPKENPDVSQACVALRAQLSPEERRSLLRIIDEKDLRTERAAMQNYRSGFCAGARLMAALLLEPEPPAHEPLL